MKKQFLETLSGSDGRETRGDRTYQSLLTAARSAFANLGFAGASVRDIAREAGVNPALIRYHFGSKKALYQQVITSAMDELRSHLILALQHDGSPKDRIQRVMSSYFDHLLRKPDFPRLIQRALLSQDPHVRAILQDYLSPLFDLLPPPLTVQLRSLGSLEDVITSMFGAMIVPFLYDSLLSDLFGHPILSASALERRREHLIALFDLVLNHLLKPQP